MKPTAALVVSRRLPGLLLLGMCVAGCSGQPSQPTSPTAAGPVTVGVVDYSQFTAEIAKQRGRVVLIDYWATWCGPCRNKFPHTVAMHKAHAADGLVVITASVDEPSAQAEIEAFLKAQQADTLNFRVTAPPGQDLMEVYHIEGSAIPFIQLYDRQGKLRQTFGANSPPFTDSDIDAAVAALLKEPG